MSDAGFVQVITTTDSEDGALALARSAVEARVAACAQVGSPIRSVYWWQGAIEDAQEWPVTFKATAAGYPALEAHIKANHSYDTPEILATAVFAGNAAYLEWIATEAPAK